ncbi:hypothetical protein CTB96_06470 [Cryobacterium arcticum]|uniref:Uncharacterized protein n=1 Tax=Cryobacterium arcticum TaxID=670052 RepID=A0A317ZW23_9MICO|nr:hypothetical protein CTB96_06470 [Cryobacterium arcticum]
MRRPSGERHRVGPALQHNLLHHARAEPIRNQNGRRGRPVVGDDRRAPVVGGAGERGHGLAGRADLVAQVERPDTGETDQPGLWRVEVHGVRCRCGGRRRAGCGGGRGRGRGRGRGDGRRRRRSIRGLTRAARQHQDHPERAGSDHGRDSAPGPVGGHPNSPVRRCE